MLTLSFLTILGATFVGSFFGQGLLLWIVGRAAHKAELKKAAAIQAAFDEAMAEQNARIRQEQERIARYAKMEG